MMNLTREIIKRYKLTHPDFEYYENIIEKIENNSEINPDISIESAKALLEGICKTILFRLEISYTKKKVNSMVFQDIFKTACLSINKYGPFETDFIHRTSSMINRMAELRNERGDISHGKATPKEIASTKDSAKMIMRVTDGIACYILGSFFRIDLSYKEKINYKDNPEFNEMLDLENPIDGISYSRALFNQDNISYEEQLSEYLDRKERDE